MAQHTIDLSERQQAPPGNATVVSLGDFTADVREVVEKAIQNGQYETPHGKWNSLPDELDGVDYIRDGERYYELNIGYGDYWGDELRAQSVE